VWGTDWPHTQFEDMQGAGTARAQLSAFVTDPDQLRAVLIDTPAALFHFQ